jgi:hypothetical protein
MFLCGRRFKIIADHAALKWLITVRNQQCARLTRWVLKLSEHDFEIVHKPGKKYVNADVLSRHIATVQSIPKAASDTASLDLTRDVILREQRVDAYCKFFVCTTMEFYVTGRIAVTHIVAPQTLFRTAIEHHHDKCMQNIKAQGEPKT